MRTLIDIPDEQAAPLTEVAKRQGIPRVEAIRRAIALYLDRHAGQPDEAFGLWKVKAIDGLDYQRALREEWGD